MREDDFQKLLEDLENEFLQNPSVTIGILGLTPVALRLLEVLSGRGLLGRVLGVYTNAAAPGTTKFPLPIYQFAELTRTKPDVLVVASDGEKEDLILAALPSINGTPKLIVAGYAHLEFQDRCFSEAVGQLLVPSLANGYPNTLVHIFQCLSNAARLGLRGIVVEFGMFKGGTTMLMAKLIRQLGAKWKIMGFDSFAGFPPRRSPLDMYDHPDCVFTDLDAVQRYLSSENVEIVVGDIAETATRLSDEQVVLAFMDTDNFTPASAALDVIQDRMVVGGAIVFDHFTGTERFRYTLGERIAGKRLLKDPRFFHLHGTGVFLRQK